MCELSFQLRCDMLNNSLTTHRSGRSSEVFRLCRVPSLESSSMLVLDGHPYKTASGLIGCLFVLLHSTSVLSERNLVSSRMLHQTQEVFG